MIGAAQARWLTGDRMPAKSSTRRRVVVDGSNLATEGRTAPSLAQLDEAIRAFLTEHPGFTSADVTVVVDATFGHRIDPSEQAAFEEAVEHGEMVTPPAGAVGRGDGFILRIAEKAGALVLSNDSFQEFHAERPWLFEPGRLIGGKPVPGVGWVFTPRTPVRGPRSRSVTAKSKRDSAKSGAAALADATGADGAGDGTGAAKATKASGAATKAAKSTKAAKAARTAEALTAKAAASKKAAKATKTANGSDAVPPATKVTKAAKAAGAATKAAKATKTAKTAKSAKATKATDRLTEKAPPSKKAAKATKPAKAAKATERVNTSKKAAKSPARGAAKAGPTGQAAPTAAPGQRPGAEALNEPVTFLTFVADHSIGSEFEGTVVAFTSHGAHVEVDGMLCHVPLRGLGTPAPTKARLVVAKGEVRRFVLISLDAAHRRAELALPGVTG